MATVENDEDKVKAQRVLSAISSSGKNNRDKFSVYGECRRDCGVWKGCWGESDLSSRAGEVPGLPY